MKDIEEMIEASKQRMAETRESMKRCDEGQFEESNAILVPLYKRPRYVEKEL